MSNKDIALKAIELVSRRGAWTQHFEARDKDGEQVEATSDEAVCFCMLGAYTRAAAEAGTNVGRFIHGNVYEAFHDLKIASSIAEFNDRPKQRKAAVVRVMRQIAERIEE